MFSKIAIFIFISYFMISSNVMASELYKITPFTAKYKVYWKNISVGTSIHSLEMTENNKYLAKAICKPNIPIFPFYFVEQSNFGVNAKNKKIIPISYKYSKQEKGDQDQDELRFSNLDKKRLYDKLSHTFQLKQDLSKANHLVENETIFTYNILKPDEEKKYEFIYIGEEVLNTKLGKLKCLKLSHLNTAKKRKTVLWFSVDKNYALVQMIQYRKGTPLITMEVVAYINP